VRLPDGNGIDLLRFLSTKRGPRTYVIMISDTAPSPTLWRPPATVHSTFSKSRYPDRVLLALKNAIEQAQLKKENARFREIVGDRPRMIGSSAAFLHAVEQASRVAKSDAPGAAAWRIRHRKGNARGTHPQ
jgi:DNA-binding NtrC family response regulator